MNIADEPEDDLVFDLFRPYVRPLGNLVILFSECEAALHELTTVLCGVKDLVIALIRAGGLSGSEIEETVTGIEEFGATETSAIALFTMNGIQTF